MYKIINDQKILEAHTRSDSSYLKLHNKALYEIYRKGLFKLLSRYIKVIPYIPNESIFCDKPY